MTINLGKFALGMSLAISAGQVLAVDYELAPVTVSVALSQKIAAPSLVPKDPDTGKDIKGGGLVDSVEYTLVASSGASTSYLLRGTKALVTKVTNKEILQDALGEGVSVTGWTLMARPAVDGDGAITYSVFAYKKNEAEIPVDLFSVSAPSALTETYSEATAADADGNTTKVTISGSASYESAVTVGGDGSAVSGLFTCVVPIKTYLADLTDKTTVVAIGVPGAAKVAGIVGNDEEGGVVSGTITFGASKLVPVAQ